MGKTPAMAPQAARATLDLYRSIEEDYRAAVEATGVTFAPEDRQRAERARLLEALLARGARVRNGGASVVVGPLSEGCVACTGNCVSRSFALTNNCHRDCFFCFNPNQEEFAYYCEHPFPWRRQLEELAAEAQSPRCVALTGGEPLLMPEETVAFFAYAKELFPQAHLRLYTSGDLLTQELLEELKAAGLDEIRFSVKHDDPEPLLEKVFERMAWARATLPVVMVEMPVIPGMEEFMRTLLKRLDALGVDGINLLEFTYAMWNWPVYESLGLTLKNPPLEVTYNYSYAGSLAVERSEEAALELMLWALDEGLTLSMHYCSLENKHRAQVRNINETEAAIHPCYGFDYEDFFLKTLLVFGEERASVRAALTKAGCKDFIEDRTADLTAFHPRWLSVAQGARVVGESPHLFVSFNVVVKDEQGNAVLRELKVAPLEETLPIVLEDQGARQDEEAGCLGSARR